MANDKRTIQASVPQEMQDIFHSLSNTVAGGVYHATEYAGELLIKGIRLELDMRKIAPGSEEFKKLPAWARLAMRDNMLAMRKADQERLVRIVASETDDEVLERVSEEASELNLDIAQAQEEATQPWRAVVSYEYSGHTKLGRCKAWLCKLFMENKELPSKQVKELALKEDYQFEMVKKAKGILGIDSEKREGNVSWWIAPPIWPVSDGGHPQQQQQEHDYTIKNREHAHADSHADDDPAPF